MPHQAARSNAYPEEIAVHRHRRTDGENGNMHANSPKPGVSIALEQRPQQQNYDKEHNNNDRPEDYLRGYGDTAKCIRRYAAPLAHQENRPPDEHSPGISQRLEAWVEVEASAACAVSQLVIDESPSYSDEDSRGERRCSSFEFSLFEGNCVSEQICTGCHSSFRREQGAGQKGRRYRRRRRRTGTSPAVMPQDAEDSEKQGQKDVAVGHPHGGEIGKIVENE